MSTPPLPPSGPPTDAPPVCPRHPDRVSYVRCQRCGRPACPECQRPAAVGVQCVDCVAEAQRNTRSARTVFGGTARGGRPVVTLTIIGLCAVSWILQLATGGAWTQQWAFSPAIGQVEPWRFLTAAFLHSTTPLHILFNMYALWLVGPFLEQAFGRARFIALYVLAAVGGQVGVLLLADPLQESWYVGVVGASGAVFGLFGAIIPVLRRLGRNAGQIVVLIAINMALPLWLPNIAWQAHVGGLVVGLALGAGFALAPRERQRLVGWALPTAVGVLLVAAAVWKYSTVPTAAGVLGLF
ncbi:rhomboid family intramembrane serine protease [Isoptericola sp. b408]|uniref:Rhomboid family intramembrane serine protease n=1 Tax=Isoptericola sediminis TaxID=2733572 RepID=A0A849K5Y6_9MICO|nr:MULTISPECIES: rhomboid family intramembrane serine protease [unclassified Isoptericola]MDO8147646.1 rhomboid family intramembrane serine protease [Isoptericola sp. b515]MDO8150054.1 rhomboid family intramembrane serine protease [Isoptericola sp. b408]NNU27185.1 rhomboid family intramembrane serine protease [Isoptericola sediminis]